MTTSSGSVGDTSTHSHPPTRFYRGQVTPRRKKIVGHWTTKLTAATTALIYGGARWTSFGDVPIDSLRATITAYAALSFGASISGCILILTLPSREFIRTVGLHKLEGRRLSSYSDLLFVFTFSAVTQLWTIGAVIGMYGLGGTEMVLPAGARLTHHALLVLATTVVIFSVFRLLVVVTTLSQLGVVIEAAAVRDDTQEIDADALESSDPEPSGILTRMGQFFRG